MWILLVGLTSGLIASTWAGSTQDARIRSCSHVGVFHVQGNDRYTLNFDEAKDLCQHLGATLASPQQVNVSYWKGLETCRYGWINDGNVTILRHNVNDVCAKGQLGVIIYPYAENNHSDAYCYDKNDLSDKNCALAFNLDPVPQDSGPAPSVTAGKNAYESSPASPVHIVTDVENTVWNKSTSIAPSVTSGLVTTAVIDATEEITPADPLLDSSTILEPELLLNATSSPVVIKGESDVEDHHTTPSVTELEDELIDEYQSTQSPATSTEKVIDNGSIYDQNEGSGMSDPTPTTTTEPPMNNGSRKLFIPENNPNVDGTDENLTNPSTDVDHDTSMSPEEEAAVKETISKSDLPPHDSKKSSSSDLVVIVLVVLAVVIVLLLCLLYVMRNRWCGKSKTLMITKSNSEGNGTAAAASSAHAQEREQEMVTLMNKEKIQENGNTEEFTVITLEESPEKNEQA